MQKTRSFREFALACCVAVLGHLNAQVSQPGTNPPTGSFVGHDVGNSDPVLIKHEGNFPIELYTNNIRRMWLRETLPNQVVNGLQPTDLSGHLGIGFVNDRPLTYLHINRQLCGDATGYRTWMRTGLLAQDTLFAMTYLGIRRPVGTANRSSILSWSQVLGFGLPTQFSFTFTSDPQNPVGLAGTANGLEIARMVPDENGNVGYFGIGNFFNANIQPDESLDVLNGGAKIRELPTGAYMDDGLEKMVVVDDDGLLHWRDVNTIIADDCDRTVQNARVTGAGVVSTFFLRSPLPNGAPQSEHAIHAAYFALPTHHVVVDISRS